MESVVDSPSDRELQLIRHRGERFQNLERAVSFGIQL